MQCKELNCHVEWTLFRLIESALVSTNLFQDAQAGSPISIECKSIPAHLPIDYCRFVLPDGSGFSINEESTAKK